MIRWCDNPEMTEFMKQIIPGKTEGEIREAFCQKFGITLTTPQIKGFKTSYSIPSGTTGGRFEKGHVSHNKGKKVSPEAYTKSAPTMFKKGNVPVNHKPVGTEEYRPGVGYVFIKVAEPNKWRLKQRVVWEEHYGEKLTNNDVIIFLDDNPRNLDIDNLVKLTRAELCRLNYDKLSCGDPEVKQVAISIAKIKTRMHRKDNNND